MRPHSSRDSNSLSTGPDRQGWRCTVARLTTRTLLYPLNTSDKVGSFAVVRASGAALTSSSEVVVALYEASLFGIVWCTELPWVRAASTRGIQTILAHAPSSNQFTSDSPLRSEHIRPSGPCYSAFFHLVRSPSTIMYPTKTWLFMTNSMMICVPDLIRGSHDNRLLPCFASI